MHKLSFLKLITRNPRKFLNPLHKAKANHYGQGALNSYLMKTPTPPFLFKPKTPTNFFGAANREFTQIKRYFSHSNQPHHNKWRSRFRWILTTNGVISCLFVTNVAVFLSWEVADPDFMSRNFSLHLDKLKSGHFHTLITSAFSHLNPVYFLGDMFLLFLFGRGIGRILGPGFLLKLYLAGAFSGSIFVLVHEAFLAQPLKDGKRIRDNLGLGATAAVKAVMMLDLILHAKSSATLAVVILMLGYDICLLLVDTKPFDDGPAVGFAYMGGDVVALIVWAWKRHRIY